MALQKEQAIKEEKKQLLQNSEVSLILDVYDDIFSDFDPRPFVKRALSIDFLEEAKRATRDLPTGQIQLKFLIPYSLRNIPTEIMIKRRLKEHFAKHFEEYKNKMRNIKIKGAIMALGGIGMIFVAKIMDRLQSISLSINFLKILLEAGGWFTAWVGLENAFESLEEKSKMKAFYEKMSRADITFIGY